MSPARCCPRTLRRFSIRCCGNGRKVARDHGAVAALTPVAGAGVFDLENDGLYDVIVIAAASARPPEQSPPARRQRGVGSSGCAGRAESGAWAPRNCLCHRCRHRRRCCCQIPVLRILVPCRSGCSGRIWVVSEGGSRLQVSECPAETRRSRCPLCHGPVTTRQSRHPYRHRVVAVPYAARNKCCRSALPSSIFDTIAMHCQPVAQERPPISGKRVKPFPALATADRLSRMRVPSAPVPRRDKAGHKARASPECRQSAVASAARRNNCMKSGSRTAGSSPVFGDDSEHCGADPHRRVKCLVTQASYPPKTNAAPASDKASRTIGRPVTEQEIAIAAPTFRLPRPTRRGSNNTKHRDGRHRRTAGEHAARSRQPFQRSAPQSPGPGRFRVVAPLPDQSRRTCRRRHAAGSVSPPGDLPGPFPDEFLACQPNDAATNRNFVWKPTSEEAECVRCIVKGPFNGKSNGNGDSGCFDDAGKCPGPVELGVV